MQLLVIDTAENDIHVSQVAGKGKGIAADEDVSVVRNLNTEFDGSSSERAILICRGYLGDVEGHETKILGILKLSH